VAFADLRFIGHEQIPPQCVQGFALVKLLTDLATVFLTAQIPQDKVRFNEPTIFL
jgi:hypothetical protein